METVSKPVVLAFLLCTAIEEVENTFVLAVADELAVSTFPARATLHVFIEVRLSPGAHDLLLDLFNPAGRTATPPRQILAEAAPGDLVRRARPKIVV